MPGFEEAAAIQRRIAHEPGCGDVTRVLTPPHEAGDFIGFLQAVHTGTEAVLIAMFPRAEVAVAADSQAAQRFSAELTGSRSHFRDKYMRMIWELLG
jgi:hypothetical protein